MSLAICLPTCPSIYFKTVRVWISGSKYYSTIPSYEMTWKDSSLLKLQMLYVNFFRFHVNLTFYCGDTLELTRSVRHFSRYSRIELNLPEKKYCTKFSLTRYKTCMIKRKPKKKIPCGSLYSGHFSCCLYKFHGFFFLIGGGRERKENTERIKISKHQLF